MTLHAGALNRRIKLESLKVTQTPSGQKKDTWQLIASDLPALVRPATAKERFTGDQVSAQFDSSFFIRFRSDVDQKGQITYDGKVYDITGIRELGHRRWLELMAKARK